MPALLDIVFPLIPWVKQLLDFESRARFLGICPDAELYQGQPQ
jgi:hypothetical protein